MRVVLERCYNDLRLLTVSSKTLKAEGFFRSNKVHVLVLKLFVYLHGIFYKTVLQMGGKSMKSIKDKSRILLLSEVLNVVPFFGN